MIEHFEELPFLKRLRDVPRIVVRSLRRRQQYMLEHPSEQWPQTKQTHDSNRGSHRSGSYSVRLADGYRALFTRSEDEISWYWIGSHADYDNLLR